MVDIELILINILTEFSKCSNPDCTCICTFACLSFLIKKKCKHIKHLYLQQGIGTGLKLVPDEVFMLPSSYFLATSWASNSDRNCILNVMYTSFHKQ